MAEKTKSPKTAKAKAPKPAAAKAAHAPKTGKTPKAANAPKATKGSVKAVKAASRTKSKPQSIETPSVETHVETFHVLLAPLPTLIHAAKPHASEQAIEFSSFAQAKERAIDHLIELIEEAERRLHLLRRATSHEEGRH